MRSEASLDHLPARPAARPDPSGTHPFSGSIGPLTGPLADLDWGADAVLESTLLAPGEPGASPVPVPRQPATGGLDLAGAPIEPVSPRASAAVDTTTDDRGLRTRRSLRAGRRAAGHPPVDGVWQSPARVALCFLALVVTVAAAGGGLGWYLAPESVATVSAAGNAQRWQPASAPSVAPSAAAGTAAGGGAIAAPSASPLSADPGVAPAAATRYAIDLSHWSLTIPVDGGGGQAALVDHAHPVAPWLVRAADGSLTFWAPVDGATTRGSSFPRTELRETLVPGDNARNWTSDQKATLAATLAVTKVPASTGKIIIGQIHGYNGTKAAIGPLVMIYYVRGDLVVAVRSSPTGSGQLRTTVAHGIRLGQVFSYRIRVSGSTVHVDLGARQVVTAPIKSAWRGVGLYFKAGVYLQASGSSARDGGRAVFYALTATH